MRNVNFRFFHFSCLFTFQLILIFNAEESSTKLKKFRCFAICVAGCIKPREVLRVCEKHCHKYIEDDEICNEKDALCWDRCGTLINSTAKQLNSPTGLSHSYQKADTPSPTHVQLAWNLDEKAVIYLLQVQEKEDDDDDEKDDLFDDSDVSYLIATNSSITFHKPKMCPVYEFRVASVNEFGYSNFSQIAQISVPIPYVQNVSLRVIEARRENVPYFDPIIGHSENESIALSMEFNPPIGWNMTAGDFSPIFELFLQHCPKFVSGTAEGVTPTLHGDSMVKFRFPLSRLTSQCNQLVELSRLVSSCKTEFEYAEAENMESLKSTVLFIFNCSSVIDSQCPTQLKRKPNPQCAVEDMEAIYNASESIVHVKWSAMQIRPGEQSPDFYDFIITRVDQPFSNVLAKPLNSVIVLRSKVNADNLTAGVNFEIPINISINHAYFFQICQGYRNFSQINRNWPIYTKYLMNINDAYAVQGRNMGARPTGRGASSRHVPLVLGLLGVLGLFGILALLGLFWRWRKGQNKGKAKSIDQLRLGRLTGSENEDDDSRYVLPPRRFDQWELSRKRLIVDEDQKLGSGAFGAVYKGKISGKLLTHANFHSVLAENWMKSENCDAAVKMLHSYADEVSKSEFMKEISLMKQLGYHERLVNMLACITADEPLCLIVEYCSEGDLLHYLRSRRKYMIKLEEANLNINESDGVDTNMILCLKDLISFAWQISTGMEYLSQKGFLHRDLAARNILVDKGKKAKIGDFGLCRYSNSNSIYVSKGGRLPFKWMALEAIKTYEFTVKSDVWSYGVLLFEIITLGGSPYPGVQPVDTEAFLDSGRRMEQPENCSDELYEIMLNAWNSDPEKRRHFDEISAKLREMLENLTEDYMYMSLNKKCDYYNLEKRENCDVTGLSLSDSRLSTKSRDPQNLDSNDENTVGFSNSTFLVGNPSKFSVDSVPEKSLR